MSDICICPCHSGAIVFECDCCKAVEASREAFASSNVERMVRRKE